MKRLCHKCGYFINETARFCNQCGERLLPIAAAELVNQTPSDQAEDRPEDQPEVLIVPLQASTPPHTASLLVNEERAKSEEPVNLPPGAPPPAELAPNIAAMLCYPLSIVSGLIFLSLRPYSQLSFVRFHAYQSIYFFFVLFILNFIVIVLSVLLPDFLERLMNSGLRLLAVGGTFWLMYQAYLGVRFKFPYVGDLAETQSNKR